ncbi:MAG: tetratricopeptide repeat protein [Acidobacteria bacterium]|nr:tetratricopeptide repeat protein [Acidobacteriota bacterium]
MKAQPPDDSPAPDARAEAWPPEVLSIGAFEVRPGASALLLAGEVRHLPPQQMDLLLVLARSPGRTVPREEIAEALWSGVEVEEGGLSRCVSELRKALGDDARNPCYIETVPKRGYRLVAEVGLRKEGGGAGAVEEEPVFGEELSRPKRRRRVSVVVLVLVGGLVWWGWARQEKAGRSDPASASPDPAGPVLLEARSSHLRPSKGAGGLSSLASSRTADAETAYAAGITHLRRLEGAAAARQLETAVASGPADLAAHLALAEAYEQLGRPEEARRVAQSAVLLAAAESEEQRLQVEAWRAWLAGEPARAADLLRALRHLWPRDPGISLRLAETEVELGDGASALAALADVSNGGEGVLSARMLLVEAEALRLLGRLAESRDRARQALASSRSLEAPALAARALEIEALALFSGGDGAKARSRLEAARQVYRDLEDVRGQARSELLLGSWQLAQGEFGAASVTLEGAVRFSAEAGDLPSEIEAWILLARVRMERKQWEEAKVLLESCEGRLLETPIPRLLRLVLRQRAILAAQEGEYSEAGRLFERVLELVEDEGPDSSVSGALSDLGRLRLYQGDLGAARVALERAVELDRQGGRLESLARSLYNLSLTEGQAGRLQRALTAAEETVEVLRDQHNPPLKAAAELQRAELLSPLNRLPEAESAARRALRALEEVGDPGRFAEARLTLVLILVEQDRLAEAREEIRRAEEAGNRGSVAARVLSWKAVTLALEGRRDEALAAQARAAGMLTSEAAGSLNGLWMQWREAQIWLAVGEFQRAADLASELILGAEERHADYLAAELRLILARAYLGLERGSDAMAELGALERESFRRGWKLLEAKTRALQARG